MRFLEVQPASVHLKGISRTTAFTLRNTNEFLAVSYAINFEKYQADNNPQLSLFPEKGILLRGEQQKVRIKYIGGQSESRLGQFTQDVIVSFTYKIEYNRAFMLKNSMKGWQKIPEGFEQQRVVVQVGGEKEAIENYIKEDIMFNQKFGSSQIDLSVIQASNNDSFMNEKSFQNLAIDSRIKGSRTMETKSKLGVRERPNLQTGIELPIEDLCPLQYGQSRNNFYKKKQAWRSEKSEIYRYPLIESKLVNEVQDVNKSFLLTMKTVKDNNFGQEFSVGSRINSGSFNRNTQLVILAILAAFFVALGNNLGRVVS